MNRPIDANAISIMATARRTQDRLELKAILDVRDMDLTPKRNLWTGKVEIIARFAAADGSPIGKPISQTESFNLSQTTYEAALQRGLVCQNQLAIPSKATELRLLFSNPATGKIGTLTIPMSDVAGRVTSKK